MQQQGFQLVVRIIGQNDVQPLDVGARDDFFGGGVAVDQQIEGATGCLVVEGEVAAEGGLTVKVDKQGFQSGIGSDTAKVG